MRGECFIQRGLLVILYADLIYSIADCGTVHRLVKQTVVRHISRTFIFGSVDNVTLGNLLGTWISMLADHGIS